MPILKKQECEHDYLATQQLPWSKELLLEPYVCLWIFTPLKREESLLASTTEVRQPGRLGFRIKYKS